MCFSLLIEKLAILLAVLKERQHTAGGDVEHSRLPCRVVGSSFADKIVLYRVDALLPAGGFGECLLFQIGKAQQALGMF